MMYRQFHEMELEVEMELERVRGVVTLIFTAESILKLAAFGCRVTNPCDAVLCCQLDKPAPLSICQTQQK